MSLLTTPSEAPRAALARRFVEQAIAFDPRYAEVHALCEAACPGQGDRAFEEVLIKVLNPLAEDSNASWEAWYDWNNEPEVQA